MINDGYMGEAVKVFDASNEIVKILDLTPSPFRANRLDRGPLHRFERRPDNPNGKMYVFRLFFS